MALHEHLMGDSADSTTLKGDELGKLKQHEAKQAAGVSSGASFGYSLDIGHGCALSSSSPITADMFTVELSDAVDAERR